MPPPIDDLVLPNTEGMAIDDEYTRASYDDMAAVARRYLLTCILTALAGTALFVLTRHSALGLAAALVALGFLLWLGNRSIRMARALSIQHRLVTNHPWRPGRITRVARAAIAVELDTQTLVLSPARLTGGRIRPATVSREQIWLCGPDAAGWIRVRAAGQVTSQLYKRVTKPPAHTLEQFPNPLAPQQTLDDFRRFLSGWLSQRIWQIGTLFLFGVLALIAGVGAVHPFVPLVIGETAIGLGMLHLARVASQLPDLFLYRRQVANQPFTTPLRLISITRPRALRARVEAELDLPDGRMVKLRMPKARLGLIANVRAGAPASLHGELAQRRSIAVVIAGQPSTTRTRAHVVAVLVDQAPNSADGGPC